MDTELVISPKRTDARAVFRVEEAFNASLFAVWLCVLAHDGMGWGLVFHMNIHSWAGWPGGCLHNWQHNSP